MAIQQILATADWFERCMSLSLSACPDKLKGSLRFSDKAQLPPSAAAVTVK